MKSYYNPLEEMSTDRLLFQLKKQKELRADLIRTVNNPGLEYSVWQTRINSIGNKTGIIKDLENELVKRNMDIKYL